MSHSGKWIDRSKMIWRSWYLSVAMLIAGTVAVFLDKEAAGLLLYGSGLLAAILGINVGGKVAEKKKDDVV